MRMGQGVRTGLGHRGITCVLQTRFSSVKQEVLFLTVNICRYIKLTASFWNIGLKMPKNDKFQFLDTPPTFEAQL